jgi:hypothetical protein
VQLPDGHDRGAQIDGSRMAPTLSAALCLTSVGPPSCFVILSSAFPLLPRVIHSSSSLVLVALLSPTIHSFAAACPVPFHISFSPKGESFSRLLPIYLDVLHGSSPVTPFVVTLTSRHHSYHTPRPPRWPSCPSLKLFSCSRWQREKYSLSRDAELAGLLSIPRSSY